MAASILKAMRFPRLVSSVDLDLEKIEFRTENCRVPGVKGNFGAGNPPADYISFTRTDAALPYFPDSAKGMLKFTPLLEDMNFYGLKVKGLKAGKYAVKLDGKQIAEYTSAELAKGVNLAEPALKVGPVADQVKAVVKAVND